MSGFGDTEESGAPRVCGDDPDMLALTPSGITVLPAYAGMILIEEAARADNRKCSPRMRG